MKADVKGKLWLAPLRGVTIRAFRETFAEAIRECGFAGAYAPFIPANPGIRVGDRLLDDLRPFPSDAPSALPLVPQVITKHPDAMRTLLRAFRERGFDRADLNAGCPFPMIVRRGRGSGLLRTPDVLEALLAAGCEEMGPGKFSLKVRLGVTSPDDLRALLPRINRYPLAALTVHARTAKQMYAGEVDRARFAEILAASANPVIYNGDAELDRLGDVPEGVAGVMVGRAMVSWPHRFTPESLELRQAYSDFHRLLLEGYAQRLQGGPHQLLTCMKAQWALLLPDADRRARKAIAKARDMGQYEQAVTALLSSL